MRSWIPPYTFESGLKCIKEYRKNQTSLQIDHGTQLVFNDTENEEDESLSLYQYHREIAQFFPDGTRQAFPKRWYGDTFNIRLNQYVLGAGRYAYYPDYHRRGVFKGFMPYLIGRRGTSKGVRMGFSSLRSPDKVRTCRKCFGYVWEGVIAESTMFELTGEYKHRSACWGCKGTGKRNYGDRPIEIPAPDLVTLNFQGDILLDGVPLLKALDEVYNVTFIDLRSEA